MRPQSAGSRDQRESGRNESMTHQPELTSPPLPASPATAPPGAVAPSREPEFEAAAHQAAHPRIPRWLERAELFLRVLLRMYIGLALCYAPWSRTFWDQNPLFTRFPAIESLAVLGAVRGIVTGLGLLNLWIAFRDAIRHRDG